MKKETNIRDKEAKEIRQELKLTADERQRVAKKIKQECYGKLLPDVRDY